MAKSIIFNDHNEYGDLVGDPVGELVPETGRTIQGKPVPDRLTAEFLNSLNMETLTQQEAQRLSCQALLHLMRNQEKNKQYQLIKRAVNRYKEGGNISLGEAIILEMIVSD